MKKLHTGKFVLVRSVSTFFPIGQKLFYPRRILMTVPLKSASKVKFQAIWSCYYAKLVHYFPAENMAQLEQISLIRNPFQTDIGLSLKLLPAANEAQLIDLSCDENLRGKFSDSSLCIF